MNLDAAKTFIDRNFNRMGYLPEMEKLVELWQSENGFDPEEKGVTDPTWMLFSAIGEMMRDGKMYYDELAGLCR